MTTKVELEPAKAFVRSAGRPVRTVEVRDYLTQHYGVTPTHNALINYFNQDPKFYAEHRGHDLYWMVL